MSVNGNKLRGKIYEKGFTITTIAVKIGVSKDTISNVINGNTNPSYPVISRLYEELELTPEEGINIFFDKKLA